MDNLGQPKKFFKKSLFLYLVIVGLIGCFIAGFFIGAWRESKVSPSVVLRELINKPTESRLTEKNLDFNLFWTVWDTVKAKHISQPTDDGKLFYGALKGLVASLHDPYSIFLDPEESKEFNKELAGSFEGIGAEIGIKKDKLVVIAPLPDSPAAKAGLVPGDYIVKINGEETTGLSIDYAVSLIRGKKGTKLTLTILKNGDEAPRDIEIIREEIKVKSVTWEMKDGGVGYLKLSQFSDDTNSAFNKAVNSLFLAGAKKLILDLRSNPGGYLESSIEIAGYFVEKGPVVIEEFADGSKKEYPADGQAKLKDFPVVVLVNEGSASAAEIVAGALQDYGLATLVGETTFGKGSVQDLQTFNDGSNLKLTIAKWLTPKGRTINEQGIKPDVEVNLTKEDYDNDRDPQLNKALEILSTK